MGDLYETCLPLVSTGVHIGVGGDIRGKERTCIVIGGRIGEDFIVVYIYCTLAFTVSNLDGQWSMSAFAIGVVCGALALGVRFSCRCRRLAVTVRELRPVARSQPPARAAFGHAWYQAGSD